VNDVDGVKKTVEIVIEREGKINILVSNAAITAMGPVLDVDVRMLRGFSTPTILQLCVSRRPLFHTWLLVKRTYY